MSARDPHDDLVGKLMARQIVVIAGSGVTKATVDSDSADWSGLFRHFVEEHEREGVSDQQRKALEKAKFALRQEDDPGEFLGAASKINGAWRDDFPRWLSKQFGDLTALEDKRRELIDAIGALDCPILTTNFDMLIESILGLQGEVLEDVQVGIGILNGNVRAVLHLHGHYLKPTSLVLDQSGYDRILAAETAQALLGTLATKTLLFIGCGATLDDPNLGSLKKLLDRFGGDSSVFHARLRRKDEPVHDLGAAIRTIEYGDDFPDLVEYLGLLRERAGGSQPAGVIASKMSTRADEPTDVVLHLARNEVRIECAALHVQETVTARPDWARMTSVQRLDALLYQPPSDMAMTPAEHETSAQLLGNHLMMLHGIAVPLRLRELGATFEDRKCRVVLHFDDDESEGRLWECLYSKNSLTDTEPRQAFVARGLGFSIVRQRKSVGLVHFPKRRPGNLRVLVVVCDPDDTLKAAEILDELRGLPRVDVQEPTVDEAARKGSRAFTANEIRTTIEAWERSILGHGIVDVVHIVATVRAGPDTDILLDLGADDLKAEDVRGRATPDQPPPLVVLQLQPEPTQSGSTQVLNVAAAVSSSGIPNVMALHHRSGDRATIRHLRHFYELLSEGERLDRALALAPERYKTAEGGIPSLVFPVLYLDVGKEDVLAFEQGGNATPGSATDGTIGNSTRTSEGRATDSARAGSSPPPSRRPTTGALPTSFQRPPEQGTVEPATESPVGEGLPT